MNNFWKKFIHCLAVAIRVILGILLWFLLENLLDYTGCRHIRIRF